VLVDLLELDVSHVDYLDLRMPSELPEVSLVVLNYNGLQHLQSCLGSVVGLDYPAARLEVILCDNGSSDGSLDWVRSSFPGVRIVDNGANLGFAEGNNRGAAAARTEWVGFLNNDIRVEPDWLRNLVAALGEQPGAACLASRILSWDGSAIDFIGGGVNFQGHGYQLDFGKASSAADKARRLLFACAGAMLVRREAFEAAGRFDPHYFGFFEDVDLGWRLNLLGQDVWYTPEASVFHKGHGSFGRLPAHRSRVLYERNALYTIYKCLDDASLAAALPAALYLLNERALTLSGLDLADFAIDAPPPRQRLRGRVKRAVLKAPPDAAQVSRLALSHYVALRDFAHSLDWLNAERERIQSRRVRSDAEILELAGDPFHPNHPDPAYLEFYAWLCRVQGLDRRFAAPLST
jgi:GT2 family glycosyltransferase